MLNSFHLNRPLQPPTFSILPWETTNCIPGFLRDTLSKRSDKTLRRCVGPGLIRT